MNAAMKLRAKYDLEQLIKSHVSRRTLIPWLLKVHDVFAKYWPKSNVPEKIARVYLTVIEAKGHLCVVETQNGMTINQKEVSAKGFLRTQKSLLEAEIELK